MFPGTFDFSNLRVALAGRGLGLHRRLAVLKEAGAKDLQLFVTDQADTFAEDASLTLIKRLPTRDEIASVHFLFVTGLGEDDSRHLAAMAREEGALVNTEDIRDLCDFHVPAMVRRGNLLLAVSTGGKSPGLARRVKRYLEGLFGDEWAGRLTEIGEQRDAWRDSGMDMSSVASRTDEMITEKGWLP